MPIHVRLFLLLLAISLVPLALILLLIPGLSSTLFIPSGAPLLIILFVMILAVTLVSLMLAMRLTLPLRELGEIARKIQMGDLSQRASIEANNFTGELALAFNTMLDTLQSQHAVLEKGIVQATRDLQEKIASLEDSKKATLNLIEDLEKTIWQNI